MNVSVNHLDPMCGGCPSAGSVPHHLPQGNSLWPGAQPGFPAWPQGLQPAQPMQPEQPTQPQPQPQPSQPSGPCWTGQPGTPCWPGMQPAPAPAPTPAPAPAPAPAAAPDPAPPPASSQATAPFQLPAQVQNCGVPCWPGTQYQPTQPQYQPTQPQYQPGLPPQYQPGLPPQYQPGLPPQYQPVQPQPQPSPQPQKPQQPQQPQLPPPAPSTAKSGGWPTTWGFHPGQPGWPGQNPGLLPPQWPVPPAAGPLSVPYNLNLARGVYDRMLMTIMGNVKPKAKMFTINFLRGNDIAFHINPRFNELGKQVLVRNHKVGANWGKEERDLKGPFPFAAGSPFEMKILCTMEGFRVAVNNVPTFEFLHHCKELNQIDRINILHDVVLTYINVETLP